MLGRTRLEQSPVQITVFLPPKVPFTTSGAPVYHSSAEIQRAATANHARNIEDQGLVKLPMGHLEEKEEELNIRLVDRRRTQAWL